MTRSVTIRVPVELFDQIQRIAQKEERSISNTTKILVKQALAVRAKGKE